MLVVMLLSIVLFALLGELPLWLRLVSRSVGVPVIAGIGYDLRRRGVRPLRTPTLPMPRLTTAEAADTQRDVAIVAATGVAVEHDAAPGRSVGMSV